MLDLRYSVYAYATMDNQELQAGFMSLSLATQWAKASAILEGPTWDFRVMDEMTGKIVAICKANGTIETPNGVAFERKA